MERRVCVVAQAARWRSFLLVFVGGVGGWVNKWHRTNPKTRELCQKNSWNDLLQKKWKHTVYFDFWKDFRVSIGWAFSTHDDYHRLGKIRSKFFTTKKPENDGLSKKPFISFATWTIIPVSKCLITMISFRPLSIGLFPFQMAFPWLINGSDPKHLQVLGWSSK